MNSVHVRYFRRMTACPTLAGLPGSKQRLEFAKCSTVSVLSIGRVSTDRLARTVQQMVSVYERCEFLANPPLWIHAQPDPVGLLFSPLWFFGVCQLKRKVPLSCLVLNPINRLSFTTTVWLLHFTRALDENISLRYPIDPVSRQTIYTSLIVSIPVFPQ